MARKPNPRNASSPISPLPPQNIAVAQQAAAVSATVQRAIQQQTGHLAVELSLAAVQVLTDEYNWPDEQTAAFTASWLARARANREKAAGALGERDGPPPITVYDADVRTRIRMVNALAAEIGNTATAERLADVVMRTLITH